MGRGWADDLSDLALAVSCSAEVHHLYWSAGRLRADAHPDLDGETALAALGGDLPPCVDAVAIWRRAVADGAFLAEWCDHDLDDPVYRHHLRIAVDRLRNEGFSDLLRGVPPRRAEAMGRFLLRFPQAWVDRAALGVVRGNRQAGGADPLAGAIRRAVQVRARSSFVRSLARWNRVVRPAALVRFECVVTPWDTPPHAAGVLDGTASWCRVGVSPRWLVEVWGPGRAVDDRGDLVLGHDGMTLRWETTADGRLAACVRPGDSGSRPADGEPDGRGSGSALP